MFKGFYIDACPLSVPEPFSVAGDVPPPALHVSTPPHQQAYEWLDKARGLSQTAGILGHEARVDSVRQKIDSYAAAAH